MGRIPASIEIDWGRRDRGLGFRKEVGRFFQRSGEGGERAQGWVRGLGVHRQGKATTMTRRRGGKYLFLVESRYTSTHTIIHVAAM